MTDLRIEYTVAVPRTDKLDHINIIVWLKADGMDAKMLDVFQA